MLTPFSEKLCEEYIEALNWAAQQADTACRSVTSTRDKIFFANYQHAFQAMQTELKKDLKVLQAD